MSRALGTFEHNWTLGCVCDSCNKYFADNLELPLGRDSLEALLRVQLGVKPLEDLDKILYRRLDLSLQRSGPLDGLRLRMTAVDGGLVPDAPAQVALRVPDGEWCFIDERQLSRESVSPYLVPGLEARIFGRTGTDDTRRLVDTLRELGVDFNEQARMTDQYLSDGPSMQILHKLNIDVKLQRAVAKIIFNYLAYTMGPDVARRPAFDAIRMFIRYQDMSHRLVTAQHTSVLVGPEAAASRAHVCAIGWEPSRRALAGVVSLFNTLTYGVHLCFADGDEWTTTQQVHAFDPIARTIFPVGIGS